MSGDICIGPNGGCAQCYRRPCICNETDAVRHLRETREARARKVGKAHGREIELLECEHCQEYGVVPDNVRREYICLKCGKGQTPFSAK